MGKEAIKVKNLSFSYKNDKSKILDNCSFTIIENHIIVLLGINGSGKSTLFNILIKNLNFTDGNIQIFNKDIKNIKMKELAKTISFVSQINTSLDNDCIVREFLVEGRTPHFNYFQIPKMNDYLIVEKYAKLVGIESLLNKNMQKLSGGQLQLIFITRALVQETPIIIMDEPMSALDINNQVKILNLINKLKNSGKTIIFSTHDPNHATILNADTYFLYNKKIISNNDENCPLDLETINKMYGGNLINIQQNNKTYFNIDLTMTDKN